MIELSRAAIGVLLIVAYLILAITYTFYEAQKVSDNSLAYNLGQASGYLSLLAKHPLKGTVVIVAVVVVVLTMAALSIPEDDGERNGNPPPEIAPIVEDTLRMPTTYPFERQRVDWPPFIGHPVAIGERDAA